MFLAQIVLFVLLLVSCCVALVWLLADARRGIKTHPVKQLGDREQILEMTTGMGDYSSLSVYKKAYNISDSEIAAKRKDLKEKGGT